MLKKCIKNLSLVISILLVLSVISGCITKDKEDTKDKGASKLSDTISSEGDVRPMKDNLYLQGIPIVKNRETFDLMITYGSGHVDTNDLPLYKEREERTNVKLNYIYVMSTTLNERKMTMFATNDFPDAMVGIIKNDDIVRYSPTGIFLPVDEYVDKYMPNLKKLMKEYPDVKGMSKMPDGKMYGFPRLNFWSVWPGGDTYINTTWIINQEWLDTLKLKTPETTEEVKEVLMAFKTKDPNGNGKPDEIPYSFCYSDGRSFRESMFGPFGLIGPGKKENVENGKVFFVATDPRYKDVVKYVRDLYTNGLIDKEAFSHTREQFRSKGVQADPPIYGMTNGWMGDDEVGPRIRTPGNSDAPYVPMPPVAGPNGTRLWGNQIEGIVPHIFVVSSKCKSPETLARYVDELYSEDESVQECWGAFGEWVEKRDDGTYARRITPEGRNTTEWMMESSSRMMPYALTDALVERMRIQSYDMKIEDEAERKMEKNIIYLGKDAETKYIYSVVYAPYAKKEVYPGGVIRTPEEIDEIARLLPQIQNLIEKKEVEWMTGVADIDAEYDDFIKKLKEYKIDRITELYQAAYDRYMGK
ncbi:MAG TPA: extracellular solute-binding protein [Clostridiales bacterium]|nr:extracellular solute-binding protein [Clostridiales bacterium]